MTMDVSIPATDVNSESAEIVEWHAADGAAVQRDQLVAEVETSKSVIEIVAPDDGFLLHAHPAGTVVPIDAPIATLFDDEPSLDAARAEREQRRSEPSAAPGAPRASRDAAALAEQHGIDLRSIEKVGLITTRDVEARLASDLTAAAQTMAPVTELLVPPSDDLERILLVGGGLGATQVLEILSHDTGVFVVGAVDDDPDRWGETIDGVPIVGGTALLELLHAERRLDAAVITISTSITARTAMRELAEKHGIPLANAIDPSARIASGVVLGQGNVLCAFCHLGVGAVVGDNNFLSAHNSFDHHTVLGSDISTGPGCMASGLVHVGDRVRMGTGIFIEPKVTIGDDAVIASGAVLVTSVAEDHIVKTRAGSTVVSPRRR